MVVNDPALLDPLRPLAAPAAPRRPRTAGLRAAAAFAGPAFLVSIGYMDPGNWGTDLAAGSRFGYSLLWVLVAANLTAVMLQYLSAKLGIATGQDLAAAVGSRLGTPARIGYWLVAEGAMLATEMAEFIGVVVALRLLLGIGLAPAIGLGAVLVLGLLASRSLRRIERVIFLLLGIIGGVYALEVAMARPSPGPILAGATAPSLPGGSLPVAVGILGAVVMPHNLFLHSGPDPLPLRWRAARAGPAPLHCRDRRRPQPGPGHQRGHPDHGGGHLRAPRGRGRLPRPGPPDPAPDAGTAGRHRLRRRPAGLWARLLDHRQPGRPARAGRAAGLAGAGHRPPGRHHGPGRGRPRPRVNEVAALVWSQVALSLALPAVAIPLVALTSRHSVMGQLANRAPLRRMATAAVALLVALNLVLLASLSGS
jgi:Natural resistance-associated macrophage protein